MNCKDLREMLDSYIGDELMVETNHEVLRHLERCPDCRAELAMRRDLRTRVRAAIQQAAEYGIDPAFRTRTAVGLRDQALRPAIWGRFRVSQVGFAVAVIAFFILAGVGGLVLVKRSTSDREKLANVNKQVSDPGTIAAVQASWQELNEKAVGDHQNCAVAYRLTEKPIGLDDAAQRFDVINKDIDKVITTALRDASSGEIGDIQFVEAHSCLYDGRRFAHIVLRQNGRLISVLVTDTGTTAGSGGIETAQFAADVNSAGIQFGHYAVFVVSDLPAAENIRITKTLAPAIRLHSEKLGA